MKYALLSFLLTACAVNDTSPEAPPEAVVAEPPAAKTVATPTGPEAMLTERIESSPSFSLVSRVDHAKNGATVEVELAPNVLLLVDHPSSASLMQMKRSVGLDLPHRIQVLTTDDGVFLRTDSPAYLAARHGLIGMESVLDPMTTALNDLLDGVEGTRSLMLSDVPIGDGIITAASKEDFKTTTARIRDALNAEGGPSLMEEIDHQAAASKANITLEPTTLFVFGNPAMGSPLMKATPGLGLDLPQKMLVYEEAGVVYVIYNDPRYLVKRHSGDVTAPVVLELDEALRKLATGA